MKKMMSATSRRAPTPPPIAPPNFALSSPGALEKSQYIRNITLSCTHLGFGDDGEVALGDGGIDSGVELARLYTAP